MLYRYLLTHISELLTARVLLDFAISALCFAIVIYVPPQKLGIYFWKLVELAFLVVSLPFHVARWLVINPRLEQCREPRSVLPLCRLPGASSGNGGNSRGR